MNINIVLDSDYICKKLSDPNSAKDVEHLFMIMKQKSNIIIVQDKNQKIINKIVYQLKEEFKKDNREDLEYAKNFITELDKGTNQYDFITDEIFENDISTFIAELKKKNYPLKMIISDKNFDQDIKSFTVDDTGKIFKILENYSKKHIVTNNKDLLNPENPNLKALSFNEYKDVLFNTFWCSDKITIIAKEFFEHSFNAQKPDHQTNNRERYIEGFKFLLDCFKKIQSFTNQKLVIEIVTGVKKRGLRDFEFNGRKKTDELHKFVKQISSDFTFNLKIIEWDAGDENSIGEGHGRRIYSDYGGFDTGYMPFEIHSKNIHTAEILHKDTSFYWIDSQIPWNRIGNGNLLASRTL
jgi:hypothetical protein